MFTGKLTAGDLFQGQLYGAASIAVNIKAAGITSQEAFGQPRLDPVPLRPAIMAKSGGTARRRRLPKKIIQEVTKPAINLYPAGIPSNERFGYPVIYLTRSKSSREAEFFSILQ